MRKKMLPYLRLFPHNIRLGALVTYSSAKTSVRKYCIFWTVYYRKYEGWEFKNLLSRGKQSFEP